jgi:regulator of protease activity HflC (stomatin/prohibitin superfamily)
MRKLLLLSLVAVLFASCGYERIDAGHTGIKVNLYGDNKGVDDVALVTGAVWYWPVTTSVFEWPLYVQNADYKYDKDRKINDRLKITTKDGLSVEVPVGLNYRVDPDRVVPIFKKYRKDLNELNVTVLRKFVREGYSKAVSKFTAEELYERKTEFAELAEANVTEMLAVEGFIVENCVLLSDPILPAEITKNIELKITQKQQALREFEKVQQAKFAADKLIEDARGQAESMLMLAKAESESNAMRQKTLTPLLIEQMRIEKWDGAYPSTMLGSGANTLINLK